MDVVVEEDMTSVDDGSKEANTSNKNEPNDEDDSKTDEAGQGLLF
jgi:hypothetical protein